jgi:hypothetical protein
MCTLVHLKEINFGLVGSGMDLRVLVQGKDNLRIQ